MLEVEDSARISPGAVCVTFEAGTRLSSSTSRDRHYLILTCRLSSYKFPLGRWPFPGCTVGRVSMDDMQQLYS
jgi:hypothetical protein